MLALREIAGRAMLTDDDLLGRKRVDLDQLKEIKVRLPVRYLLQLHYMKLQSHHTISDMVTQALVEYFDDAEASKAGEAASE
jgi:hypothetical protein